MENSGLEETISSLIGTGHFWIALVLMTVQIVIIPVTMHLWRKYQDDQAERSRAYSDMNKKLIESERALTKMERDQQIKDLDTRISAVEKDMRHSMDELTITVEGLSRTLKRLFDKMDLVCAKMGLGTR